MVKGALQLSSLSGPHHKQLFNVSYDLQFVRVRAGEDAVAVAEAALEAEEAGINPGPVDPGCELRKRALAEALLRTNPNLRIFEFDFAEIATLQGTTVPEARRAFRHLELEGRGVIPDLVVVPTRKSMLAGRDIVLDRAIEILSGK